MARTVLYEAFGEWKTRREWSEDKRCRVGWGTLGMRLCKGWPCEAALILEADECFRGHSAFGESKNIIGWLSDPRCRVTASVLKERLKSGEPFERALTRSGYEHLVAPFVNKGAKPEHEKVEWIKHEAFGEARTLLQWSKDPRCIVEYPALLGRRKRGIPTEAAMVFSDLDLARYHWAFGTRKRLGRWLGDLRCTVPGAIVKSRLDSGEELQSAMSRPASEPIIGPTRVRAKRGPLAGQEDVRAAFGVRLITLFGESKTSTGWGKDPRCEIHPLTLAQRVRAGWPETPQILKHVKKETAFSRRFLVTLSGDTELGRFHTVEEARKAISRNGTGGRIVDATTGKTFPPEASSETKSRRPPTATLLTAWGETKSCTAWAKDPRCSVGLGTLVARIGTRRRQWTHEEAISTPPAERYVGKLRQALAKRYEAFGESKTIEEWTKDPRFAAPAPTLRTRIAQGIPMEQALGKRI